MIIKKNMKLLDVFTYKTNLLIFQERFQFFKIEYRKSSDYDGRGLQCLEVKMHHIKNIK